MRTDFAEKYPEVVVAYIKAIIEANAWVRGRSEAAAEKIAEWTGIDKEVVYIFLGPGGIMTLDPTIKPALVEDAAEDAKVLQKLGPHEGVRRRQVGRTTATSARPTRELASTTTSRRRASTTTRSRARTRSARSRSREPRKAGEIWVDGEAIAPFAARPARSAPIAELKAKGKKINVAYVFDTERGIKLFADQAFYRGRAARATIAPFLLKKDAEAHAAKIGGKVVSFAEALKIGGRAEAEVEQV